MFRQDYIKRVIQQVGELVAAVRKKQAEARYTEAQQLLEQAYGRLGLGRGFLTLAPDSIALLIPDTERLEAIAALSELEAQLHESLGKPELARLCRKRAEHLRNRKRR